MKNILIYVSIVSGLLFLGCSGNETGHSHDGTGDHVHSHSESSSGTDSHSQQESSQPTEEDHGHAHSDADESDHGHTATSSAQDHPHPSENTQREGSGSATQWTEKTELFMEYPEIVVGEPATFAVHLTRLSDFRPLANSEVRFHLESDSGAELQVTETEVQVPGIYGPDFRFEQSGRYDLTITIQGMVEDTIHVRGIPVYATTADVPQVSEEEDPNLITFLKEQQWKIPFGTAPVARRTVTQTIQVPGEIMAARQHHTVVSAPFAGILVSGMNAPLPVEGASVSQGAPLAQLSPAVQSENGENYVQQFINAQSELQIAKMELDRSQRLFDKEAIPETELQRTRLQYRQALIRFETINELMQIDTTVGMGGDDFIGASHRYQLKAPISGTVTALHVTPGAQVRAGQELFSITDDSVVWLQVRLPVAWRSAVRNPVDAAFTVQGVDTTYRISTMGGELISRGGTVDPGSRTLTLIYSLPNTNQQLTTGMFSTVSLHTDTKSEAPAVPVSALIEEEGTYYVFVHVSGESFEKRRITTGLRDTDWVEVTEGVETGEHVVTTNAYQVQLASLSSEAPAHGHAH